MLFLGLDIGFGNTKAVVLNERGEVKKRIQFPTLIAVHTPSPLQEDVPAFQYGTNSYVVGENARFELMPFQLSDFGDMKQYGPLIMEAVLKELDLKFGLNLMLACLSLPPGWWKKRDEYQKAFGDKEKFLAIIPQGMGSYVAAVKEGKITPAEGDTILVLDFGYNTIDYLLIKVKGSDFKAVQGNTWEKIGVTRLVQLFREQLPEGFREYPPETLARILKEGKGKAFGEVRSFRAEKRRATEQYVSTVMQMIKNQIGTALKGVDAIICTGGGAYYFSPVNLKFHHNIVIPGEPEMANARGQAILALEEVIKAQGEEGVGQEA